MNVQTAYNELMSRSVITKIEELKSKKILFGFNLANDFTPTTKIFHKFGLNADMLLRPSVGKGRSQSSRESYLAHPLWEDPTYDESTIKMWDVPSTKIALILNGLALGWGFFTNTLNYTYPGRLSRKYDAVISTPPGPFYFHKHKHNIIYDGGFARILPNHPNLRTRIASKSYKEAELVIYTNPDMKPLFTQIGVDNPTFMPFAVDADRYKPIKKMEDNDDFIIFTPSRQDWLEKGSPQLIRAFANVIKEYPKAKLVITEFGKDIEKTKELVKSLKIESNVKFVGLVNKDKLIERINNADIIADQFVIGSYGLAAPEAMACEKPVMMYLKEQENKDCFGEMPPIVNSRTMKSIENNLIMLIDDNKKYNQIGKQSREWVVEKHNPINVFEQQIEILHSVLFG